MLLRNILIVGLLVVSALHAAPANQLQEHSLYEGKLKLALPTSFKQSDAGQNDDYRFRDESKKVMIMIDHKATALTNDDVPKSIDIVASHFQKLFAGSSVTSKETFEVGDRQFGHFALAMKFQNEQVMLEAIYFAFENRLLLVAAMGSQTQKDDISSMVREIPKTVKLNE